MPEPTTEYMNCYGCQQPFSEQRTSYCPWFEEAIPKDAAVAQHPGYYRWWHQECWRAAIVAARIVK